MKRLSADVTKPILWMHCATKAPFLFRWLPISMNRVVGHILFSRMWIETAGERIPAVALAPVAVSREHQRRGIGGKLIERGLDLLRSEAERIVIVLGEPEYYSRFGFSTEKARGLASPFPPEAYMAMELHAGALDGVRGKVRYANAFGIRE